MTKVHYFFESAKRREKIIKLFCHTVYPAMIVTALRTTEFNEGLIFIKKSTSGSDVLFVRCVRSKVTYRLASFSA